MVPIAVDRERRVPADVTRGVPGRPAADAKRTVQLLHRHESATFAHPGREAGTCLYGIKYPFLPEEASSPSARGHTEGALGARWQDRRRLQTTALAASASHWLTSAVRCLVVPGCGARVRGRGASVCASVRFGAIARRAGFPRHAAHMPFSPPTRGNPAESEEPGRERRRRPDVRGRASPPLPFTGTKETARCTQPWRFRATPRPSSPTCSAAASRMRIPEQSDQSFRWKVITFRCAPERCAGSDPLN